MRKALHKAAAFVGQRDRMMHRIVALIATATLTVAATEPPAALVPYIHDGQFDPGDYGWLRGSFPDATSGQQADWRAVEAWRTGCVREGTSAVHEEFARRGITAAKSAYWMRDGLCSSVSYAAPSGDQGKDWPAFQAAVLRARPVVQAVIWSSSLAQAAADPDTPGEASLLIARPMTDQVLRQALSWGKGEIRGAPALDPLAERMTGGMLWSAIAARDHANTTWLKADVAAKGWPTIGRVGNDAAHSAWLLVQHADDDPVFQFDMLRLMEPLAGKGDVSKKDFAFLYDRVTLKITGKQRYGSQSMCSQGRYVALPLEDAGRVDALRKQMGMRTLDENLARIAKAYGPCPPDPGGAPPPKG